MPDPLPPLSPDDLRDIRDDQAESVAWYRMSVAERLARMEQDKREHDARLEREAIRLADALGF